MARRYPGRKEENWWLVVGEPEANALLAIKRVALQRRQRAKLDFAAPAAPGLHKLTLYFMCDSYLGCDQARPAPLVPFVAMLAGVLWCSPAQADAGNKATWVANACHAVQPCSSSTVSCCIFKVCTHGDWVWHVSGGMHRRAPSSTGKQ